MPYCSNCGNEVDEESRYCSECGNPLFDKSDDSGFSQRSETSGGASTGTDTSNWRKTVYYLVRGVQFLLVGFALIFVLGALIGGMNILAFATIGIFALVLFGIVGVLELLVIRPLSSDSTQKIESTNRESVKPLDREPPSPDNTLGVIEHVLVWYRENRSEAATTERYLSEFRDQAGLDGFSDEELEFIREALRDYDRAIGRFDVEPSVSAINQQLNQE